MALKTYDFKNFVIQVNGAEISGFADDEGFSIDWSEDWWTDTNGVDGDTTRNYQNNMSADIILKLKQTSESNGWLNLMLIADTTLSPKTNVATLTVSITSLVGAFIGTFVADQCWIKKPPSVSGGKDASDYEWTIRAPQLAPIFF